MHTDGQNRKSYIYRKGLARTARSYTLPSAFKLPLSPWSQFNPPASNTGSRATSGRLPNRAPSTQRTNVCLYIYIALLGSSLIYASLLRTFFFFHCQLATAVSSSLSFSSSRIYIIYIYLKGYRALLSTGRSAIQNKGKKLGRPTNVLNHYIILHEQNSLSALIAA